MKSHFLAAVALISLLITGCAAENTAKEAKVNEAVVLKSNTGNEVFISNTPTIWRDENLVARVPNGTKATIQEIHKSEITPEYILVRFKVITDEPSHKGWVHSFDAGYSTEDNK